MIPVDHTIPLLMIPDNRTECGDPDQSQYGVGDLYPVSLAPFISHVGVTALRAVYRIVSIGDDTG